MRRIGLWLGLAWAALLLAGCAGLVRPGPADGEEIEFFPSIATPLPDSHWRVTLQGRVSAPVEDSRRRRSLIEAIERVAGVDEGEESEIYHARTRLLLSDSRPNRQVAVELGSRPSVVLAATDAGGVFRHEEPVAAAELGAGQGERVRVVSRPTEENARRFAGEVRLLGPEGVVVVTDMDDTIKVTQMLDRREKLKNQYLRPYAAVPGMAQRFRDWQAALGPATHFHVVTAAPWQINPAVREFTQGAGFPFFTWDMHSLSVDTPGALLHRMRGDTFDFKTARIRELIQRLPQRRFVLVGDSGEADPEVYAQMLQEFPGQVAAVYIRDVTGEAQDSVRYVRLFGTSAAKLQVFRDAGELPANPVH